jgi:hypothetical protein
METNAAISAQEKGNLKDELEMEHEQEKGEQKEAVAKGKRLVTGERKAKGKKAKVDNKTPTDVEGTILKNTSTYLFEFSQKLTPLEKLHEIVHDSYLMSNSNHDLHEIAVYVNPTDKLIEITY